MTASTTEVRNVESIIGVHASFVLSSPAEAGTMYLLQGKYDARLKACLEDTPPMAETERLQRALHIIITDTGQMERKGIEDKS